MKVARKTLELYAITNRKNNSIAKLCADVEEALKAGVTCLQIREKNSSNDEFLKVAKAIKPLCEKYNVPLIINDNLKIALAVGADGLHIGQNDGDIRTIRTALGENKILGVTANNKEEALDALKNGADYLGSGSVFPTSTKDDVDILDHKELEQIIKTVNIPVVAIGGITKENIMELAEFDLAGVSVISAIFSQDDIFKATRELKDITKRIFY